MEKMLSKIAPEKLAEIEAQAESEARMQLPDYLKLEPLNRDALSTKVLLIEHVLRKNGVFNPEAAKDSQKMDGEKWLEQRKRQLVAFYLERETHAKRCIEKAWELIEKHLQPVLGDTPVEWAHIIDDDQSEFRCKIRDDFQNRFTGVLNCGDPLKNETEFLQNLFDRINGEFYEITAYRPDFNGNPEVKEKTFRAVVQLKWRVKK